MAEKKYNLEKIKTHLLDYVEEITEASRNGSKNQYICPLCNSGTGQHRSGAFTVYPDTDSYHCFACGANGDIFNLYGEMNNLSDFKVIVEELQAKYNIYFPQPMRQAKKTIKPAEPKKEKDYTKFFALAEQRLHETDYLTKRGLSVKTQQKFHCGYIFSFAYKNNQTTPAVIIPTSNSSFMWRSTTDNIKQKRGTTHILNPAALTAPYCFVVEGEIDCMSIDECGFASIGLGSISNIRKIFDFDTSKTVLIIALDNDQSGKKAAVDLAKLCDARRVPYITASNDIWGSCKDANEFLVKNRAGLIASLQAHSERAIMLDKNQWNKDMHQRQIANSEPKPSSESQQVSKSKKKQIIDFKLFSEFIEERGYSIRYNQITHDFEFSGFDDAKSKEHLAENVPTILQDKLKKLYTRVSKQTIIDYITLYGTNHKYNPVLDAIKSVKWDGIDRVNQIYNIFKIPADTEEGMFSRIFIFKWLKQCVCGLYNDIEKPFSLDIILVFQGKQGIGKTRFFEMLALNSRYFGEGICLDPRDKDSVIQATSKWISELGEIGSTMRKDMDSVKAFLTKSTDEYRTPYGKASLHYPRMTSFVGTVNDDQFLIDQTGNRRFVTIPLPSDLVIDYNTQIKTFNSLQLWSQIYELVKDKHKSSCFRLSEEEKRYLEKRNSAFVKPMKGEYEVLDILEEEQTPQQGYICTFKEMTVTEFIRIHNLKYDARTVGQVLKKYGYESKWKKENGKSTRVIKLPYKKYCGN
ncbi:MAG: toprim domain-containing protein [Oscillospiraceae bacterium]|nr:toprim domain-containing protein [Oscillospiraceae bacterium]